MAENSSKNIIYMNEALRSEYNDPETPPPFFFMRFSILYIINQTVRKREALGIIKSHPVIIKHTHTHTFIE